MGATYKAKQKLIVSVYSYERCLYKLLKQGVSFVFHVTASYQSSSEDIFQSHWKEMAN